MITFGYDSGCSMCCCEIEKIPSSGCICFILTYVRDFPVSMWTRETIDSCKVRVMNPLICLDDGGLGVGKFRSVSASVSQILISMVFPLPAGQREHLCFSLSATRDSWQHLLFLRNWWFPNSGGRWIRKLICIYHLQRVRKSIHKQVQQIKEQDPLKKTNKMSGKLLWQSIQLLLETWGFSVKVRVLWHDAIFKAFLNHPAWFNASGTCLSLQRTFSI